MFEFKKLLPLFVIFIIVIIVFFVFNNSDVKEDFYVWNYPTRYYPSYDLRGYPYAYTFPWNWYYPLPYWSPYYYGAGGKYFYNPKLRRTRLR